MQVKVMKIEGFRDPEGNEGRRIELVQEIDISLPKNIRGRAGLNAEMSEAITEGARLTLTSLGMPCLQQQKLMIPKIILFLTEDEYDKLEVSFEVNQLYTVTLEGHAIKFEKTETETEPEPTERAMGDKERH